MRKEKEKGNAEEHDRDIIMKRKEEVCDRGRELSA